MAALELRLAEARTEAEGIRALRLVAADGALLPPFTAGAHLRVHPRLADGRRASRSYSLVSAPTERDHYEIGVLRTGRGAVSDALHALAPGATLDADPPRNDFALAPQAGMQVLVAGGIGITPLLSMATLLAAEDRPFRLWVQVCTRARLPFADRLARLPAGSVHVHVSSEHGRLDPATPFADLGPEAHVYTCGPRGLIDDMRRAALAAGLPAGRIHEERFDAAVPAAAERSFVAELRASGLTLTIAPGQTILERALAANVFPAYDCQRGECGVCLTRVLDGRPEHRDSVQSASEKAANAFIAICCSRALGERLVLDL